MHGNITTGAAGQEALSLSDLIAKIKHAHGVASDCATRAIRHAIEAGEALALAKGMVKHGEWQTFLRRKCEIGDRQARRYMQLAELSKRSCETDLTGLSIEQAVRKLSPVKSA